MLEKFNSLLHDMSQPHSGIPQRSHIGITLKFFIADILVKMGDMESAAALCKQIYEVDVEEYFGSKENEFTIESMLIILNHKFD